MLQKSFDVGTISLVLQLLLIHISLACQPLYLPPLNDDHRGRDYTEELKQFIIPTYQFPCHGLVTSWAACVDPGGGKERYDIHFQVWRPQTVTDADQCYTLVGTNIPNNLLEPDGHCVSYMVPPGEEIQVSPGDVIGFYADRYHEARRGSAQIEDENGGGIQLDSEWFGLVEVLIGSPPLSLSVGTEWCSGGLSLLGQSPVLEAIVDPIQPPITPSINSSTAGINSSTAGINPPASLFNLPTTSIVNLPTTSAVNPPTTSAVNLPTTSAVNLPTTSIVNLPTTSVVNPPTTTVVNPSITTTSINPSVTKQLQYNTTHIISSAVPTPIKRPAVFSTTSLSTTQSQPTSLQTSVRSLNITSSSIVMTSPPLVVRENPTIEEEIPPLLIAGLFIAGILLIAIVALTTILITMCLTYHHGDKDKNKQSSPQNDNMEYCEAYTTNTNTNKMLPNVPMVWNRAYNKCRILEHGNEPSTTKRPPLNEAQNNNEISNSNNITIK